MVGWYLLMVSVAMFGTIMLINFRTLVCCLLLLLSICRSSATCHCVLCLARRTHTHNIETFVWLETDAKAVIAERSSYVGSAEHPPLPIHPAHLAQHQPESSSPSYSYS